MATIRPPCWTCAGHWATRTGHRHYRDGHIPGAVYVDLDTELAAHAAPGAGRHPLPELADLQAAARRWGVRTGQPVVIYDNAGDTAAARAWWLLRWAGVPDVRLLDGALKAWREHGFELASGEEQPAAGDVELRAGQLPVLTADQAAALAEDTDGVLLDARAGERYRGEVEPIDPRAGHIPGALSAPTADNLTADGTFRPAAELRDRFAQLNEAGSAEVGVYCGSGVTAAHEIAALAVAGIPAALYHPDRGRPGPRTRTDRPPPAPSQDPRHTTPSSPPRAPPRAAEIAHEHAPDLDPARRPRGRRGGASGPAGRVPREVGGEGRDPTGSDDQPPRRAPPVAQGGRAARHACCCGGCSAPPACCPRRCWPAR